MWIDFIVHYTKVAILGLPHTPEPPLTPARPWALRPRAAPALKKYRFDRNFVHFTSLMIINYVYDTAFNANNNYIVVSTTLIAAKTC